MSPPLCKGIVEPIDGFTWKIFKINLIRIGALELDLPIKISRNPLKTNGNLYNYDCEKAGEKAAYSGAKKSYLHV